MCWSFVEQAGAARTSLAGFLSFVRGQQGQDAAITTSFPRFSTTPCAERRRITASEARRVQAAMTAHL